MHTIAISLLQSRPQDNNYISQRKNINPSFLGEGIKTTTITSFEFTLFYCISFVELVKTRRCIVFFNTLFPLRMMQIRQPNMECKAKI